jgi:hypothetical protein
MTAVHGNRAQLLLALPPNVAFANQALTDSGDHKTFNSSAIPTKRYWDRTASWTVQAEANEVQTITLTGGPTGGTYTLTFGAQTTAAINWNDPASTVQTRLQALSSILSGNVLVTGPIGGPYTVEFASAKGFAAQSLITRTTNSLTGGSSPDAVITRAQGGFTWTTQAATTYTIQYVGGVVTFNAPFLGTSVGCRINTGAYFNFTAIGDVLEWSPDISRKTHSTTCMTTNNVPTRWETFLPGLAGGSVKINRFLVDNTYVGLFTVFTDDTLILSLVMDATTGLPRLEAYGKLTKDGMKVPLKDLEMEDLDFVIDGQMVLVTS